MSGSFDIAGHAIGGRRTFVVAELSANHGGKLEIAIETLKAMAASGADAVKLQTYHAESLTLPLAEGHFRPKDTGLWKGWTAWNLFQEAHLPWEWTPELMRVAGDLGMVCFSSPFDWEAVDFLANLHVPAWKIASFEITDIPLIQRAARHGQPMILSTGIALEDDIERAVRACREVGNDQVMLLKCTSAYPAPMEDMNLRAISTLSRRFGLPIGLSDHTMGHTAAVAAVALGAAMVEKHFILRRSQGGADSAFSMEPEEFAAMVRAIREVEDALGDGVLKLAPSQEASRRNRRSLFVAEDIRKGEELTLRNVRSIRPGAGLPPEELERVLGKRARQDLPMGTPLSWDVIEDPGK